MTRLAYQIPNFTYPDTKPSQIFDNVVAQAKAAEAAGYDRVMVMDHFYQLPGIGAHDEPMFEYFPNACAVANIAPFADGLTHRPRFVASHEGGAGFVEIVEVLLERRAGC